MSVIGHGIRAGMMGAGAPDIISNGALFIDECTTLPNGWTETNGGGADTTSETFDSRSSFKMLCGATPSGTNQTKMERDVGSFGARTVYTLVMYNDLLGTRANNDRMISILSDGVKAFFVSFSSDGLWILQSGLAWFQISSGIVVQDEWATWTFDINWTTLKFDVYKNKSSGGSPDFSGIDFDFTPFANGTVRIDHRAFTSAGSTLSYIDRILIGDDFA